MKKRGGMPGNKKPGAQAPDPKRPRATAGSRPPAKVNTRESRHFKISQTG